MIVYKVTITTYHGTKFRWSVTHKQAVRAAMDAVNDFGADNMMSPVVEPVDIKFTRQGIVNWLNEHLSSGNL